MKEKNNEIIIYATVVLIVVVIIIGLLNKGNTTKYALGEIINEQKEVDDEILRIEKDKTYTLSNPKLLVNPYKLSPLTALVLFNTDEETSITVNVNDEFTTTVEKSTTHNIPIYGLRADYKNIVKLTDEKGNTKELEIKTKPYTVDKLEIEVSDEKLNDELYFLSPNFVNNCIYDKEGNLVWYIEGDYAGDIIFLENNHFLISDPYQGTNGVKINYAGFIEMDYLGKIYTQYITPHGYHHEIVPIKDNKIITTGAKDGSPFLEAVLYIMDLNTGESVYSIDFYDYFHNIAPDWVESLGTNFDFVLNSISYDESSNDVILSFRGFGAIVRFDLDSSEIKWMIADPNNLPEELHRFLLNRTDNTKYPYGEHSAVLLSDGTIAFHNNDADQFNMKSQDLKDYLDKYTTNVIIKVDENNRTFRTVWEYDANKNEWSKVGGRIEILPNENKLLTYGWSISKDSYDDAEGISINDTKYLHGIVVELDKDNNVLFKGKTNGLLYRVYKMNIYNAETKNFEVSDYKLINGNKVNADIVETSTIKNNLKSAKRYTYNFDVLINRVMIDIPFTKEDSVDILFVKDDNTYIYNYKKANDEVYNGFNSNIYGVKVNLDRGEYKAYVKINDVYYDTKVNIIF